MANPSPTDTPTSETPRIRINSGQYNPFENSEEPSFPAPHHGLRRTLTPEYPPSLSAGFSAADSTEYLIPPRPRLGREDTHATPSPDQSAVPSRRTSISSDASGDGPGYLLNLNPFDDSRSPSRADSEENDVNTQTVSEKYNIMPSAGLLLFPEDVERDDYMHNPDPNDKERDCDVCNRRGFINLGGLVLICLGFLMLFIGYPVLYVPSFSWWTG